MTQDDKVELIGIIIILLIFVGLIIWGVIHL